MGKHNPRNDPPGWYWRIRIALEAIKAAVVIVIKLAWEVFHAHRSQGSERPPPG